ncbi:hypothetical protein ACPV5R_18340 [Vibrio astriarenae]
MSEKKLTEEELLEGLTAYTAHELIDIDSEEWTKMLNLAKPTVLNDADYERFVAFLNSDPDPTAIEDFKKLFKRKAPWE